MSLELWLRKLDADDGGQAFTYVFALKAFGFFLEKGRRDRKSIQRPRHRRFEADEMSPALDGGDVVGEREYRHRVALVPLHRDLDRDSFRFPRQIDDIRVDRRLGAIEMLDERYDTALEEEFVTPALPFVTDRDS